MYRYLQLGLVNKYFNHFHFYTFPLCPLILVDPYQRAEGGETVLHWACQSKRLNGEVLQLLFTIHVM